MLKTDITEIKKRLKKDNCLPRKVTGCIVSTNGEILAGFNTFFGNLDESDRTKYLEIAGKVLSGKIGNNAIELSFPAEAESEGGAQADLMALRDSDFLEDDLRDAFFAKVIASYKSDREYVIFLFHDIYDVMTKGTDNLKEDESETVFDYLLCAICPLEEAKPGLVYSHSEKMIRERIRDWVVTDPEIGFIFPAFTERETDIHSVLYHVKSPLETQEDFVNSVFGCEMIRTSEDKKEVFGEIINGALSEEENVGRVIYGINESLRDLIETKVEVNDPETGEVVGTKVKKEDMDVSDEVISKVLTDNDIEEEKIRKICDAVKEEIGGAATVDEIIDRKLLAKEKHQRREEELLLEIAELKEENRALRQKLSEVLGTK